MAQGFLEESLELQLSINLNRVIYIKILRISEFPEILSVLNSFPEYSKPILLLDLIAALSFFQYNKLFSNLFFNYFVII